MFKNSPLEKDVIARLEDDPRIADSAEIAVAGDGGIITLRGAVERFSGRRAAEHDARGVAGVYEVINHLKVNLLRADRREDDQIRGAALQNLIWDASVGRQPDNEVASRLGLPADLGTRLPPRPSAVRGQAWTWHKSAVAG